MSDFFRRLSQRVRQLVGDESFTVSILVAVAVTCVFAFMLGAEGELVVILLALGVVTALAESRIRKGMKG